MDKGWGGGGKWVNIYENTKQHGFLERQLCEKCGEKY